MIEHGRSAHLVRPGRRWLAAGAVFILIGIGPIATTMLAAAIAQRHGCPLDEGSAHRCIVLGRDGGEALYALGAAFWLELATIWLVPVGLVLLVIGVVRAARTGRRRP